MGLYPKDKPESEQVSYESTQHGSYKGYNAFDVQCFNEETGQQVNPGTVADIAKGIPEVGGIGIYDTFNHIDTRGRKADGTVYSW